MNKIEEIFEKNIHKGYYDDFAVDCHRSEVVDALKEFGGICFEAGRENNFYINEGEFVYKTYKDFLKEIEDEKGN
jgi:hypothetical protein